MFPLAVQLLITLDKDLVQKQLEDFLSSLPSPKNLHSATPTDITHFLVWKDKKGKTKVHTLQCPLFGTHSKSQCNCPHLSGSWDCWQYHGKTKSYLQQRRQARALEWTFLLREPGKWHLHSILFTICYQRTNCSTCLTKATHPPLFWQVIYPHVLFCIQSFLFWWFNSHSMIHLCSWCCLLLHQLFLRW